MKVSCGITLPHEVLLFPYGAFSLVRSFSSSAFVDVFVASLRPTTSSLFPGVCLFFANVFFFSFLISPVRPFDFPFPRSQGLDPKAHSAEL